MNQTLSKRPPPSNRHVADRMSLELYIFFICTADGGASMFEAHEAGSLDDAKLLAISILEAHPSGEWIEVGQDGRVIHTVHRKDLLGAGPLPRT